MRGKVLILVAVALAAAAFHALTRPSPDPLAAFPHTFIAKPGYDPAEIVVIIAPISEPPLPEGLAPAMICVDPAFGDGGRPWLVPVTFDGKGNEVFPVHPGTKRAPSSSACKRYHTAEGAEMLRSFLERTAP